MTQPNGPDDSFWARPGSSGPPVPPPAQVPPSRGVDPYQQAPQYQASQAYQQFQAYQGGPSWQQPRSSNLGRGCLVVVLGLMAALVVGILQMGSAIKDIQLPENDPTPHSVKLVVTASVPSDVNWSVGATSGMVTGKKVFSKTVETTGNKVVSLSVTPDPTTSAGSVSCEILVDGVSIDKRSADKGGLASCTGRTS